MKFPEDLEEEAQDFLADQIEWKVNYGSMDASSLKRLEELLEEEYAKM